MVRFAIRIELLRTRDLSHGSYSTLHNKMESSGYSTKIYDGDRFYKLPPAEYVVEGNYALESILASVKEIANSVDANNRVIVFEYLNETWLDLNPV